MNEPRLVLLTKATKEIGSLRKVHVSALFRWATKGIRLTKLRTVLIDGKRYTRCDWVKEFLVKIGSGYKKAGRVRAEHASRRWQVRDAEAELAMDDRSIRAQCPACKSPIAVIRGSVTGCHNDECWDVRRRLKIRSMGQKYSERIRMENTSLQLASISSVIGTFE